MNTMRLGTAALLAINAVAASDYGLAASSTRRLLEGDKSYTYGIESVAVKSVMGDRFVEPRRKLQECGSMPTYVISAEDETRHGSHTGSYENPIQIVPGCPYSLEIAPGKAAYFSLTGFNVTDEFGSRPQLYYGWSVRADHDETPITFFSFLQRPAYAETDAGNYWDWYWWPLLHNDATTFREDNTPAKEDYYHCYGYCGYEYQGLENTCSVCQELDLRYFYDELMISVSTYNAGSTMTVEYTADLIYPAKKIIMEELDVIKEMYRTMCEPYANAPVGWTWEDHRVVESDARGEKDSRNKPYCDWWPEATSETIDALGETDCLEIPGIVCDSEGHVSNIILDTKGLRGPLPDSFSKLVGLQYVELPNNRISGSVPSNIFDSPNLKEVSLDNNMLVGEIPCPVVDAPTMTHFSMSRNELTGELPGCIFTEWPNLQVVDLSHNKLQTEIPVEINLAKDLGALYLSRAGITGTLAHLTDLNAMARLDLSHNFISGEFTQEFIDSMSRLYAIDLSWNELTGSVPTISNAGLRIVDLAHNMFDGEITEQFVPFAANQDRGSASSLDISSNSFCGPLPEIFYDLLMDSHYFIYSMDVSHNHFRCAKSGNNMYFESWTLGVGEDFGMCIPIPVVTEVEMPEDGVIRVGQEVKLHGQFMQTTGGSCMFTYEDGISTAKVPAIFYDEGTAGCELPMEAQLGMATVTVAHYCDDYASAETLNGYTPIEIQIYPMAKGDSSDKKSKNDKAVVLWASLAACIAFVLLVFVLFVVYAMCRERSGNPIFKPLQFSSPIHETTPAKGEEAIDLQVQDDVSAP